MVTRNNETSLQALVAEAVSARAALPIRATYRMQFNHTFTFTDATALVPYLAKLGVSHLYASPVFQAAPGSLHGYDVVDFGQFNTEIGTRAEFEALVATLREHDMGIVIDFVPNHMGIEKGANAWWQDMLQNGRMSRFAEYFDIDWHPLKRELHGKVLVPFLGDQYGQVLERGELKLGYANGAFTVHYWDSPFPIDPATYPRILLQSLSALADAQDVEELDRLELESIINAFDRLETADADEPARDAIDARYREQIVTTHRLSDLMNRNKVIATAVTASIDDFNGTVGDPSSFDDLDILLAEQSYRLSYWRVASEEINYRRFFAINSLAAIRQEDREVFAATHELLMDLLVNGLVDGVRFDHPDGLWDPERYFHDVQMAYLRESVRQRIQPESEEAWEAMLPEVNSAARAALQDIATSGGDWPVWTVAEKILEHDEALPTTWKLDGTVGYEFMQAATGVLVSPQHRALFDTIYRRYTGENIRYSELVYEMKLWQVREAFASELNVLTNVANRISESDRHSRDFTSNSLRVALREVIANFGVYRTYTTCRDAEVTDHDAATINAAVDEATRRNPRLDPTVFDFVRASLLLHHTGEAEERRFAPCHFAMKLQQLSGPVMAKGLEDTTFYRFNRLTSLNEVGGDPSKFGTPVSDLHRQNQQRLEQWPRSMINSSTHDTKRSEDVRAAISVLSERPTEWRAGINRWTRLNRKFKNKIDGALAPTRIDEWVFYQTLIGTWPQNGLDGIDKTYITRIQDYMIKVVREAGRFSNWVNPNQAYEESLQAYVDGALNKRRARAFLNDLDAFVSAQRDAAIANALSQQVLKLTSPGVPDVYQGTELWDDSLVDPDNRRPVDYSVRERMLGENPSLEALVADRASGQIKLDLTRRLLHHRTQFSDLFSSGIYTSLRVSGDAAEHVIAFLREHGDQKLIVIAPRLMFTLANGEAVFGNADIWGDTTLHLPASIDQNGWRSVLDGGAPVDDPTSLTSLFTHIPIAVLTWQGESV